MRADNKLLRDIKILFGNRHEIVASKRGNTHRWTLFVKTAQEKKDGSAFKYIEKVRYRLHPSFGSEFVDIKGSISNPEFAFSANGYGTFSVPIEIFLRKGGLVRKLELVHMLNFDRNLSV